MSVTTNQTEKRQMPQNITFFRNPNVERAERFPILLRFDLPIRVAI
jgi:hypothetical protein